MGTENLMIVILETAAYLRESLDFLKVGILRRMNGIRSITEEITSDFIFSNRV